MYSVIVSIWLCQGERQTAFCKDGGDMSWCALRYHCVVLLIDENSNQRVHPGSLFPVQVSTRQQTEAMTAKLLTGWLTKPRQTSPGFPKKIWEHRFICSTCLVSCRMKLCELCYTNNRLFKVLEQILALWLLCNTQQGFSKIFFEYQINGNGTDVF